MKILWFAWLLALSCSVRAQGQTSTLVVYSEVMSSFNVDVSLFLNGQSIYPAPLAKGNKLVHTVHSTGKITLLAKVTNNPGFRSATLDLEFVPGKKYVLKMGVTKLHEQDGYVWLANVSDNAKHLAKLDKKAEKWSVVESEEEVADPYVK